MFPENGKGLGKTERLYLRRHIELVVREAKVVFSGDYIRSRALWVAHVHSNSVQAKAATQPEPPATNDSPLPPQVLISVGKRYYKRANRRNLAKRRLREAYRLHKQLLDSVAPRPGHYLALHMVWIHKPEKVAGLRRLAVPSYALLAAEVVTTLQRLAQRAEGLPTGRPAYKPPKA